MSLISNLSIDEPGDSGPYPGVETFSRKKAVDEWLHQASFLLDSITDAVISTDLDFIIKSWNKGAEDMYGLTALEVIGQPSSRVLMHEYFTDDREKAYAKIKACGKWKGEVLHNHRDGRSLYLEVNCSSVRDQGGSVIGYVSICRDITDMRRVKEILVAEQQRLRDLIQNVPGVVYQWEENYDGSFGFTYVSPKMEEYFGVKVEDVLTHPASLIHPEDRKRFRDSVDESNRTETPWEFEGRLLYPDGTIKWWRGTSIMSTKNEKGRIYNGIMFDITAQKDLEKRLANEEKRKKSELIKAIMEAQEKERKEISSELHDNVNQILTTCKLLLEIAGTNPAEPRFIDECYKNIQLVIQEIRNISHNLTPHTLKDLGLAAAIRDLVEKINQSGKLAIRLTAFLNLEEDKISPDIKLTLFRIIQETISNVLKHSSATEFNIGITLAGDRVQLQLNDNGQGFDENTVKKGLGLNNIHNRVEYYKGCMQLRSEDGKGCELNIELPCGL
jgi:PAS domain S-box-containing protein